MDRTDSVQIRILVTMDRFTHARVEFSVVENPNWFFCDALYRRTYFECCLSARARHPRYGHTTAFWNRHHENTWAVHQLFTTGNFSPKSHIINWFTGGLNHQIEHHIFPYISHIHYSKIARIVKETAREFDLPYHEFKTFASAFKSHYNHLKALGKKPMPVEI